MIYPLLFGTCCSWVGGFFGVDFADDLDARHNVEVDAAFFEGAALPEALFCVGFYPAGDELLPAGDVDADVVAWMGGEVVLHGWVSILFRGIRNACCGSAA